MTEKEIITQEQLRLSPEGGRLWRTIPGKLWKGFFVERTQVQHKGKLVPGVVLACPYVYELFPVGEPDCHLYKPVIITPEMLGSQFLQFGKAEIKTLKYKTVTKKQRENLQVIARKGGIALIIREMPGGYLSYEEVMG